MEIRCNLTQKSERLRVIDESCLLSSLTHLNEISLATLEHPVVPLKSSTCLSDCPPTWFPKEVSQTISPDPSAIINCSLSTGVFPSHFKDATINPLLKKPLLNLHILANFRPISKPPFLAGHGRDLPNTWVSL